ncbi:regulatory protein, Fis family [Desulfatibacillum alkenivorans DSM 16219]|jgi:transcriptional regulator with PAS, ATPase and Fis domain|uniref:Regulatory protein, Fis family n=1 Tax=Desulfatibacillum alkenivorans DSM 16219 TaxID=1121393 RepID=A0A1M6LP34_9BACT|nr:sigma-54 dependent transcriptional regulator [Desulfatibacillum alkenivorans]SHJ72977.1 regulatory protein, Fis family [Desulfatibacillum alkenivorans DSM 16219]
MRKPKDIIFTCQFDDCKKDYTINQLLIAAYRHGIAFLDIKRSRFKPRIGITCTHCNRTTFYTCSKGKYSKIKRKLGKSLNLVKYGYSEDDISSFDQQYELVPDNIFPKNQLFYRWELSRLDYITFNVDYSNIANDTKKILRYQIFEFIESAKSAPYLTLLSFKFHDFFKYTENILVGRAAVPGLSQKLLIINTHNTNNKSNEGSNKNNVLKNFGNGFSKIIVGLKNRIKQIFRISWNVISCSPEILFLLQVLKRVLFKYSLSDFPIGWFSTHDIKFLNSSNPSFELNNINFNSESLVDGLDIEGYCYCDIVNVIDCNKNVKVFSFQEDEIQNLQGIENSTGLIVFPRHYFMDFVRDHLFKFAHKAGYILNPGEEPEKSSYIESKSKIVNCVTFLNTCEDIISHCLEFQTEYAYLFSGEIESLGETNIRTIFNTIHYCSENLATEKVRRLVSEYSNSVLLAFIEESRKNTHSTKSIVALVVGNLVKLSDEISHEKNGSSIQNNEVEKIYPKKEIEKIDNKYTACKNIVSVNEQIDSIKIRIAQFVNSPANQFQILFTGESGTGKELFAKAAHQMLRPDGPFKAINCGSIQPTLLESELFGHVKGAFSGAAESRVGVFGAANGGTLFLDEIGEMPIDQQKALLRVLETKKYRMVGAGYESEELIFNGNIVCATNANIEEMIESKKFRTDLFYRINKITFHIPPLKNRPEDIPFLTDAFVLEALKEMKMPADAISVQNAFIRRLQSLEWPGNVRELKSLIERIVHEKVLEKQPSELVPSDLENYRPENEAGLINARRAPIENIPIPKSNRQKALDAIEKAGSNKTEAAKLLGISRKTLYNWLSMDE